MGAQLISSGFFEFLPSNTVINFIITSLTNMTVFIFRPIRRSIWSYIGSFGSTYQTKSLGMIFFMRYFPYFYSSILFKMTGRTQIFPITRINKIFLTNISKFKSFMWFFAPITNTSKWNQFIHSFMKCPFSNVISFPLRVIRTYIPTFSITQFMFLFRFGYGCKLVRRSYILLFSFLIIINITMEGN